MHKNILLLRNKWCRAVINKNVKEVLACYANNALFKGTLRDEPVQGKKEIKKYFNDFVHKVKDIKFSNTNYIYKKDELYTEMGTYTFFLKENGYDKKKIVANYQFIYEVQNNQEIKIISHFSSLSYK